MWNFVIGCFILGAATVGLIHGKWGSLIAILAVVLWFTRLARTGSNILAQFFTIAAISMTVVYAYQEFTREVSDKAVVVVTVVLAVLFVTSAALWGVAIVRSRREESEGVDRRQATLRRGRPTSWWAEILVWLIVAGIPFALGAAAAEANFNDEEDAAESAPP